MIIDAVERVKEFLRVPGESHVDLDTWLDALTCLDYMLRIQRQAIILAVDRLQAIKPKREPSVIRLALERLRACNLADAV